MGVDDYLIDHAEFDWPKLLACWEWFLDDDAEVQPWLMNRFGDLFFVDDTGVVLWLNITDGELSEVAADVDEFFKLLDDEDNAADWFLMGLVDEAVEAGKTLEPSQCYGFSTLPVLGGEFELSNVCISSVESYWKFCAGIHAQIDGLPDGAEVEIDIPERT